MIISNKPLLYNARDGQKWAIIELLVYSWLVTEEGIKYLVKDYAIIDQDVREYIDEKEVFRSWDQLNSINEYLEANNDYTGLNKKQQEFLKVKHGLLLDTITNPVYGSSPEDWQYSENDIQ